jgi:hypothetical protein
MCRYVALSLVGLLIPLDASRAQSFSSGTHPFASHFPRAFPLSAPEVQSLMLDNELKAVKLRYEKGVAIAQGRANVSIAKLQEAERIAEARFQAVLARHELRERRRTASLARYEQQRREAQLEVAVFHRLQWPEALQRDSLRLLRNQVEEVLGGDGRYVSAGAELNVDEVRRLTKELFDSIRPLRDELGDRRLLEAKHYLEGIVRAAEAEAVFDPRMHLATR